LAKSNFRDHFGFHYVEKLAGNLGTFIVEALSNMG